MIRLVNERLKYKPWTARCELASGVRAQWKDSAAKQICQTLGLLV